MTIKRPIDVSLILCSRNRSSDLKACLGSLPVNKIAGVHGEIILVDSYSNDDTGEIMAYFQKSCRYPVSIVRAEKPGLGFARNIGVAASKGRIIVFTDDDCYLAKDYLKKVVDVFAQFDIQYCGGRILLYDETDAMCSVNYQQKFELFPPYSFVAAGKLQGANMLILRQVFDEIGGFDPTLGAGTRLRCEDIEFIGRASMKGFTGAHVPDLIVYHHHKRKAFTRDLKNLIRKNEIARGAYYAAMISKGFRNYLNNWVWHSMIKGLYKPWTYLYYRTLGRELFGAFLYWRIKYLNGANK